MSYIKQILLPDEQLVSCVRPHYLIFAPVIFWGILVLYYWEPGQLFGMPVVILVMVAGWTLVKSLISFTCSEYAITNLRLIMKVGLFTHRVVELPLTRIDRIQLEQNLFGQLFNFGTVIIGSLGGAQTPFYYVPRPLTFRKLAQQQLETGAPKPII